jgi:hypothetical protein
MKHGLNSKFDFALSTAVVDSEYGASYKHPV